MAKLKKAPSIPTDAAPDAAAQIAALEAENARLRAAAQPRPGSARPSGAARCVADE